MPCMLRRCESSVLTSGARRVLCVSLVTAVCFLASGCTLTLSPLAKHTAAFSTATKTVVDGSEGAYRAANDLRRQEQIAEAIDSYGSPGWTPYKPLKPLLTQDQIIARTKVLESLKAYADALAVLTDSKAEYKKVDASASAAGGALGGLITAGAPDLQTLFPGFTSLSTTQQNGMTTAIDGMVKLLVNGKIKKSLAATTTEMDPSVQSLCALIQSDVKVLRDLADVDYKTEIQNQDQFIEKNQIDPAARRNEIGKMLTLVDQQRANDELLSKLDKAVGELAKTHTALVAAATGKDTETLKQRVADLTSFGKDLGSYYKSLSASTD